MANEFNEKTNAELAAILFTDNSKPGTRPIPAARFVCADISALGIHYVPAKTLHWWDKSAEAPQYQPGWYCAFCGKALPGFEKGWSLADEIHETANMERIL